MAIEHGSRLTSSIKHVKKYATIGIGENMDSSRSAALDRLRQQIEDSCTVKQNFSSTLLDDLVKLAERTVAAFQNGKKVMLLGNGGSAADAQHIAAELVGRFCLHRKGLPAIALGANSPTLTAISNDFGFEESFARQMEALGTEGDIAIAISTSGRSQNVIRAIKVAREMGCYTAAFTGATGGNLKDCADLLLTVPSENTQRIQESHSLLGHLYCDLVERGMVGSEAT